LLFKPVLSSTIVNIAVAVMPVDVLAFISFITVIAFIGSMVAKSIKLETTWGPRAAATA
jgi:hypothetical protein